MPASIRNAKDALHGGMTVTPHAYHCVTAVKQDMFRFRMWRGNHHPPDA